MKLTDLKDLRVIKKSLSPEPEKAPVQNQPRKRIVFIHGLGDGILAQAIRKELDEVFALSCSYTFGPMGATNVTIR